MVRTYKKKTNRQSWSNESMSQAINAVVNQNVACKRSAEMFNVPRATLQRRLKSYQQNRDIVNATKKGMGQYRPVFAPEQEIELVEFVQDMEGRLFGLTPTDLRKLAFQLAERNNISHSFNRATEMAGEDWLASFLKRHPVLSLRKPEATSAARAMGFNRVSVNKFFELLTQTIEKYEITPDKLFNVDETGITTVAKSLNKIIATKGKKQVGSLSSAERGQSLTVEICMSADGSFMPPYFIFPRKRMKVELMDGAPPGSWADCNDSGWMQGNLFVEWFKKFITWSRASQENKVLLLLDGHFTHTKNLELVELARENGVVLLCFPPHCTHRLQPLDVSFMKPLSVYYADEVKNWLHTNPGRVVSHYQVAGLFGKAFIRAATMATAINGFRACGIWPANPNIFTDADFIAAETTNIVQEKDNTNNQSEIQPTSSQTPPSDEVPSTPNISPIPGPSNINSNSSSIESQASPKSPGFPLTSPKMIMDIPKAPIKKRVNRKRGTTAILTDSPYKNELEEAAMAKKSQTERVKNKKRKVFDDDVAPSTSTKRSKPQNRQTRMRKKIAILKGKTMMMLNVCIVGISIWIPTKVG